MNFKKYGVSKNVMPSAVAETKELNGITVTCDGKGTYTISGTASEYASIVFDIPEFTAPISIGQGGNGTLSFFNTFDTNKAQIAFYYNSTRVDEWVCTPLNRTNTVYSAIGNKTINKITFNISGGTSVQGTISPMFTNDGQLPAEFEPHMIWHDTPHYIHNTSTDTITTLPADIYANDTTATVGVKGNTTQSGTPSPDNPIIPQGTGERTAQLFEDKIANCSINANGLLIVNPEFDMYIAKVEQGVKYTASALITGGFYTTKPTIGSTSYNGQRMAVAASTVTAPITGYMTFRVNSGSAVPMLNTGETTLPYEPYGIKIPILSNSQTTNVYLGETQSTRYIAKTVLTSNTNVDWRKSSTRSYSWYFTPSAISAKSNTPFICSHGATVTTASDYVYGTVYCDNTINLGIFPDNLTTGSEVRSWLDEQYANGTPVVIWTVYTSPTTSIVNEPLRKIGDYADSISDAATISTAKGTNTLTVGTTVQPSEVTVNYKGWHPVADVHEYDNGAWT